jgi:hypothetical protein
METILGFVAGYLAGCRDGKEGAHRLRASLEAILSSDEVKKMTAEAMSLAEIAVRRAASGKGGLTGTVGTVSDILAHRAAIGRGSRAA